MGQPAQKDESFIAQLLKPLLDRMGLNGVPALQNRVNPQQQPQRAPILDERALKAMGYSDADIAYLKKIGQAK